MNHTISLDHFLENVSFEPMSGCWLWVGTTLAGGYGVVCNQYAHRLSVEFHYGPISIGHVVCHLCDLPSCVNPEHLWVGTQSQNIKDAMRKGRVIPFWGRRFRGAGEANPAARLTANQVVEIRALLKHDHVKQRIAEMFGVSRRTIRMIETGQIWAEV